VPPLIDSKLRSNLITLQKSGKYADIRLKIGDTIVPAHKCILASRSLKFKMLFESQMLDSPSPFLSKDREENRVSEPSKFGSDPNTPSILARDKRPKSLLNIKPHSTIDIKLESPLRESSEEEEKDSSPLGNEISADIQDAEQNLGKETKDCGIS
jgi:hypothetical protein